MALAENAPELAMPLSPSGDIGAQVLFAIREEMALTLEDVVMRRTGIGQLGVPGGNVLAVVASIMAVELGWSETRKQAELASLTPYFQTAGDAA